MGCTKLPLKLIHNDKSRKMTFQKRKKGLVKKLHELSVLCDIKACMILYNAETESKAANQNGSAVSAMTETWPLEPEAVRALLNEYQAQAADIRSKRCSDIWTLFTKGQKKGQVKYQRRHEQLDTFSKEQMQQLLVSLEKKMDEVGARIAAKKASGNSGNGPNGNGNKLSHTWSPAGNAYGGFYGDNHQNHFGDVGFQQPNVDDSELVKPLDIQMPILSSEQYYDQIQYYDHIQPCVEPTTLTMMSNIDYDSGSLMQYGNAALQGRWSSLYNDMNSEDGNGNGIFTNNLMLNNGDMCLPLPMSTKSFFDPSGGVQQQYGNAALQGRWSSLYNDMNSENGNGNKNGIFMNNLMLNNGDMCLPLPMSTKSFFDPSGGVQQQYGNAALQGRWSSLYNDMNSEDGNGNGNGIFTNNSMLNNGDMCLPLPMPTMSFFDPSGGVQHPNMMPMHHLMQQYPMMMTMKQSSGTATRSIPFPPSQMQAATSSSDHEMNQLFGFTDF